MIKKKAAAYLAFLFAFTPMMAAEAQNTTTAHAPAHTPSTTSTVPTIPNLDLSSTNKNVAASIAGTIRMGGVKTTINIGDLVTPAQMLALQQLATAGAQTLRIGNLGNAVGGSFGLGAMNLESLTIPHGVTALGNFSTASTLSLTGNLSNSGRLFVYSTDAASNIANIAAQNIYNNQGGLLSSVLPTRLLATTGGIPTLNLDLSALNNIVNMGVIRSSGTLTLTAGNSIINSLPTGVMGTTPLIHAVNAVNLNANNIVNSGVITSLTNNINIAGMTAGNIAFDNKHGSLRALLGDINVRDAAFTAKSNFDLTGGTLLSQNLNVFSGQGIAKIDVNKISGVVNVDAGEAHVTVKGGDLTLGNMNLSGDPTFYNLNGNVLLTSDIVVNDSLAIIATGNILSGKSGGAISTANTAAAGPTADAGSITLLAGVAFQAGSSTAPTSVTTPPGDSTTSFFVTGGSKTGGKIDLNNGSTPIGTFSSASTNGAGGDVLMVAYKGSAAGSGTVTLPANVSINTGGATKNGDVTIIAGATSGNAINIGGINTAGTATTGGAVKLTSAQPTIVPDPLTGSNIVIINDGAIDFDSGSTVFGAGATTTGGIVTNAAVKAATTFDALTKGAFTNNAGIQVGGINNVLAGGALTINAATTNVGNLLSANGIGGGAGGTVTVTSTGNLNFLNGTAGVQANGNGSGSGGNIVINSGLITGGTSAILLAANSTSGTGGSVIVTSTKAFDVGTGGGEVRASVNGGPAAGSITLRSASDLTVNNPTALTFTTNLGGTGGSLELNAGYNGSAGNLLVNGGINLSNGTGGHVELISKSATAFTVDTTATKNGITGNVSVNSTAGGAGSIYIQNSGKGGVAVNASHLQSVVQSTGNGGSIVIAAASTAPTLNASGVDIDFNRVTPAQLGSGFISSNLAATGAVTLIGGGTLSANAGTTGAGGTIALVGTNVSSTGGPIVLSATGGSTGNGGSVFVGTSASGANITVGGGTNDFKISAGSGLTGGNGGTVALKATQGNVTVTPGNGTNLSLAPRGAVGDGGTLQLAAGDSKSTADRNVLISGALTDLQGKGGDDGGSLYLISNSNSSLDISSNTVNGTTQAVSTTGVNGGTQVYANYHRNTVGDAVTTNVTSQLPGLVTASNGNGGTVAIMALSSDNIEPTKTVSIPLAAGSPTIDVGGTANNGSGGTIVLEAGLINGFTNGLTLVATGNNAGSGGTIVARETAANSVITSNQDPVTAATQLRALAGGGNGGNVYLGANALTADTTGYSITVGGANGNGGSLALIAKGVLTLPTGVPVDATGRGTGAGGHIALSGSNPFDVTFVTHDNTGTASANGSISVQSGGDVNLTSINAAGNKTDVLASKAGNNFDLTGADTFNITGAVSAKQTLSISTSNGDITTPGAITNVPEARLTAPTITLTSNQGSIGYFNVDTSTSPHPVTDQRILTQASHLSVNASNGSAYVANKGALTLDSAVANNSLMVSSAGTITVPTGTIVQGKDIYLRTDFKSNGSIILNGQVGAAQVGGNPVSGTSVRLSADGTGSITQGKGEFKIIADSIALDFESLEENDPTQPNPSGNIGSTAAPLRVDANSLHELTFGKLINIQANAGSTRKLTLDSVDDVEGVFTLTNGGAIDVGAQMLTLGGGRSNITLTALSGDITMLANSAIGFSDGLNVIPGNPPIAFIDPGSTVKLEAAGQILSAVDVNHLNGDGFADRGVIRGNLVTLIAHGGNIGAAPVSGETLGKMINVTATNLVLNATGDAHINVEDIPSLSFLPVNLKSTTLGQGNSNVLRVFSFRPITVSSAVDVANVDLEIYSGLVGDITLGANIGKTGTGTTKLSVDGNNNIFQTAGTVLSQAVTIGGATSGNIGTSAKPIRTTADTIIVGNASENAFGNTFISNASTSLNLQAGGASTNPTGLTVGGGTFSVTNTGNLVVNSGSPIVVSNSVSSVSDGTQGTYNFPFNVTNANQIIVYVDGVAQPAGTGSTTNYTVDPVSKTVVFNPAVGIPASGKVVSIGATNYAPTVSLKSTAGDVIVNANITGKATLTGLPQSTINVGVAGTHNISSNGTAILAADNINLTAATGSVGQDNTHRISVDSANVNVKTTGSASNVFLNAADDATFNNVTGKTIDIAGGAHNITLNGNFGTTTSGINIVTTGNIIGGTKSNIVGDTIRLQATDVGAANARVKLSPKTSLAVIGTNAYLQTTKATVLDGTVFQVNNTLDLTAAGNITNPAIGGTPVSVQHLVLTTTTGNIGAATSALSVNTTDGNFNSASSAYINNAATSASTIKGSAKATFDLTNAGNVTLDNVTAKTALNVTTGTNGDITYKGIVSAPTVNLTTGGTGGDISGSTATDLLNASNLTVNAGPTSLSSINSGVKVTLNASNFGDVTLSTTGGLTIKGAVTGGIVNLLTQSGNLTIGNNVTGGNVDIEVGGKGSITSSGKSVVTGSSIFLGTNDGSIGTSAAPITTSLTAANSSLEVQTTKNTSSAVSAFVNNTNTASNGTTNFTATTSGSLTLTDSSAHLNVGAVTTGINGMVADTANSKNSLVITEKLGDVTVSSNVKVNGGSATVQAIPTNSTISLADNVQFQTLVDNPGVSNNGIVKLVVGPKIPTNGVAVSTGDLGTNVVVQQSGRGAVIVGTGSSSNPITGNSSATIDAHGVAVILSSPADGQIHLGNNVLVKADPPVAATPIAATSVAHHIDAVSAATTTDNAANSASAATSSANAAKPAFIAQNPATSAVVPISVITARDTMKSNVLTGGVALNKQTSDSTKTHQSVPQLQNGGTLLAPDQDVVVQTPFGALNVAGKSIVLTVLNNDGLAIYNLHDEHQGDVVLNAKTGALTLHVGRHAFITKRENSYELLNPLGYVAHRNLKSNEVEQGLTLFTSEFSITSAIGGNGPLGSMLRSANADEKRIMNRLLKDAAIIMQTKAADGSYKRIVPSGLSMVDNKSNSTN